MKYMVVIFGIERVSTVGETELQPNFSFGTYEVWNFEQFLNLSKLCIPMWVQY